MAFSLKLAAVLTMRVHRPVVNVKLRHNVARVAAHASPIDEETNM
jgi:hypothetical protein